jgi:hypothetical protein
MATNMMILIAAWIAGHSFAAPTGMNKALDVLHGQMASVLNHLCLSTSCLNGDAKFDLSTFACACPDPPVRPK